MRRTALLLPFLFTLASLLQLFYIASIAVSPGQILRPLIVLWGILILLYWPVYGVLRDWSWSGVFLTLFVMGLWLSSDLFSTMALSTLVVFLVWIIYGRVSKVKFEIGVRHIVNILTGVGLFFACYSLVVIAVMLSKIPWATYSESVTNARDYSIEGLSDPDIKRDIYYIVLDDYARSDMLEELYAFDNSEFVTNLKELGFVVPENHHSNYPMTHLSLSSTLNMNYQQEFSPGLEQAHNRWLMKPFIDHSRVRSLLEGKGYQTISISSNWTITENVTSDIYFHPYTVMLSDFEGFLLGSTPSKVFGPYLQKIASVKSVDSQRKIVMFSFETLETIPAIPGPKFVVAHIISPHPPFVFDKDGTAIDITYTFNFKDGEEFPGTKEEYRQGYVNQLQFVNRRLQETISSILKNSQTPPIIIIQADHGSGLMTDFTSLGSTCIKERFSSFAAFYLPGVDDHSLLGDISAVNTFRVIFNEYFDAQFSILENRQYFFKNRISYFDFIDVTDRVNDRCN